MQYFAIFCRILQYFAVFCSILQHFKWYTMLILPYNTSDISLWLLQVISMASLQQINHLQQICEFLQHFAAFCSSRNAKLCWYFPETQTDISTSLHQVISLGSLLKIDHLLTLSVFLQYFAAFYSILQHFKCKTIIVDQKYTIKLYWRFKKTFMSIQNDICCEFKRI